MDVMWIHSKVSGGLKGGRIRLAGECNQCDYITEHDEREEERRDVSDKMSDGINFSRLRRKCQRRGGGGGGKKGGGRIHTNAKYLKKPKPENRLKGSLNIYHPPLLPPPFPFLCPYFLKNSITQIPKQEKLRVQPNNIMEITYDFEGKENLFITAKAEEFKWGGGTSGTRFNILLSCVNEGVKREWTGGGCEQKKKDPAECASGFLLHYLPWLQTQLAQIRFSVYTSIRRWLSET